MIASMYIEPNESPKSACFRFDSSPCHAQEFEPVPLQTGDIDCIVNAVDSLLDVDSSAIDPTPIGNSGLKIVEKINLEESSWLGDKNLISCMSSILGKRQVESTATKSEPKHDLVLASSLFSATPIAIVAPTNNPKRRRVEVSDDSSCSSSVASDESSNPQLNSVASDESSNFQLRPYHSDQWFLRYRQLQDFKRRNGHCLVPNYGNQNEPLALWVKRQRYQFKLKNEGQHSTLTDERQEALERLGFVWDSHGVVWMERLNELREFKALRGHCCVPAGHPPNPSLAIWVKCQRRQYRLYCQGKRSNMSDERIAKLEDLGFVWNPRKASRS